MRKKRCLAQDVWYEVQTAVNNNEPLFGERWVLGLFACVFRNTGLLFAFEFRGLPLILYQAGRRVATARDNEAAEADFRGSLK